MKKMLPFWFRQELPDENVKKILNLLKSLRINTICVSAHCPNINRCFKNKSFTFLIMGERCLRQCKFCAVSKGSPTDLKDLWDEPIRIKDIVIKLNLDFVVVTSVCRDDLPDRGAIHFKRLVQQIKSYSSDIKIELLIPDFSADRNLIREVVDSEPEIIAHNIEVPFRLYREIKPLSNYQHSLRVLKLIREENPRIITKSSLILGLGETEEEVIEVIEDLSRQDLDILTLGQYLAPTQDHYPVREFISLEKFDFYKKVALKKGIKVVVSGPLVRSSYMAKEVYQQIMNRN